MRSFVAFISVAVSTAAALDNWQDYEWSWTPDNPADWYQANGKPLPEIAPELTVVEANESYIVKLGCIGCPFRVRELYETVETWQEPPQDNSLLLNFTTDNTQFGLLLNGKRIAPLDPMPLAISAFQTPSNLSVDTMTNMTRMHMLDDETWRPGTKYGSFELQYEHAFVENWVQFDITAVHQRSVHNPGSTALDKEGQKMVQLQVRQDVNTHKLYIEDIQVVDRKDRVQPKKMKCGKLNIIKTEFNPLEWDYYGKFGTLERTWHRFVWGIGEYLDRNGLYIIIATIGFAIFGLVRWVKKRHQESSIAKVREDAEAALLEPEYDDELPDYADIPEIKVEDFDDERTDA